MIVQYKAWMRFLRIALLVNFGILFLAVLNKDRLPDKSQIIKKLYTEPLQTETKAAAFEVSKGGIIYSVKPVADYELYGLVVSFHHASDFADYYHREWKDYLNSGDLCVAWGDNVKSDVYQKIKFKSGSWTCYAEPKSGSDSNAWARFNVANLSNNHILSGNKWIDKAVMNARVGDQIYFKGYLVDYSHSKDSFTRRTSTKRDMNCEVVYVTDFKIIKRANELWHLLYALSKILIIINLLLMLFFYLRSPGFARGSAAID